MTDTALRLPVELRFSGLLVNRRAGRQIALVQLLLVAVAVVAVTVLLWPSFGDAPREAPAPGFWRELLTRPTTALYGFGLAAMFGLSLYTARLLRRARIRLTHSGLEVTLPGMWGLFGLKQTTGDWRLAWRDIRRARRVDVNPLPGISSQTRALGTLRLVLETDRGDYWLFPYVWHDPDNDHRMDLGEAMGKRRPLPAEALESTPLVRALRQHGIEILADETGDHATGFDLTSHTGLGAMLVMMLSIGGYAVVDQFFYGRFAPLEPLPLWPFGATAMLGLAILLPMGRGAPAVERGAVTALTLAALVAATWPGMLRYNALTTSPQTTTYITRQAGLFDPPDASMPVIDLRRADLVDYFHRFPAGSEHEFTLLRGALGIWQLDRTDLYARTRAFYRAHDDQRRAGRTGSDKPE